MIKKTLSLTLACTFLFNIFGVIDFKNVQAKPIETTMAKAEKQYLKHKTFDTGALKVTIHENSQDDLKAIIVNKSTGKKVETTITKENGKAHGNYLIKDKNDKIIEDFDISLPDSSQEAESKDTTTPILNILPSEPAGTGSFYYDGLMYLSKMICNPAASYQDVPYIHPDGQYHSISQNITTYRNGNTYHHIQIGRNDIYWLAAYAGTTLLMLLGTAGVAITADALGSYLLGNVITAACGIASYVTIQKLTDERGCIWIIEDKDPIYVSSRIDSINDCRHITYQYRMVQVGPYTRYWVTGERVAEL